MDVCGTSVEMPLDKPSCSGETPGQVGGELNSYLLDFFKNCDPAFIEEDTTFLTECLRDHRPLFKCLGDDIYLMVGVYQKNVSIQVRKFVMTPHGLVATRNGVVFSFPAWYQFSDKIYHFNLKYSSASFVCDNSLLVLSSNGSMVLRELKTSKFVLLNSEHLCSLIELLPSFNEELLLFVFENYLPGAIASMCKPSSFYNEQTVVQEARLNTFIELELAPILQSVFPCDGCKRDSKSQLKHKCIMLSNLEKYQHMGKYVMMLVNIPLLAEKFVTGMQSLSLDFLSNMNFEKMCDSVFKSP